MCVFFWGGGGGVPLPNPSPHVEHWNLVALGTILLLFLLVVSSSVFFSCSIYSLNTFFFSLSTTVQVIGLQQF